MSDESIKPPSAYNKILNPSVNYVITKARVELNGDCIKQDKISFDHGTVVKVYILYEINRNVNISSYSTLENSLFGAVKLTKHVNIDQYKYSGYGIEFDTKGFFSIGDEFGRNVIIFGVDMSSSPHKGPTQGLEHTLTAGKLYSVNFTKNNTKFCLSLHIMERIVIYLLMVQKLLNLKKKILKL